MLENSLRIVVDPVFMPPENFSQKKNQVLELCPLNQYELIFDEKEEAGQMEQILLKMKVEDLDAGEMSSDTE
jgi:hypothetical protein